MNDKINEIVKTLESTKTHLENGKDTLKHRLDEIGYQIEVIDEQKKLWKELSTQHSVPLIVTTSGIDMVKSLEQNALEIQNYINISQIDNSILTAGTINVSLAGTAISGASLSYPPGQMPQSFYRVDNVLSQRTDQNTITERLRNISSSVAEEYENAWGGLHSGSTDETRSPMFLMREVVTQLLHHFAPDQAVKEFHKLAKEEKITRKHRTQYIASKLEGNSRETFLKEEKSILDIYSELSKAHKHGSLNPEQTRGFLYQSNALIKLILDLTK